MSREEKATTELEELLGFSLSEIGTDLSSGEAKIISQTIAKLDRYTVAEPTKEATAALVNSLRQQLPTATRSVPRFRDQMQQRPDRRLFGLLNLIRPQVSLLGKPFWLASAIVCCLGLFQISSIADLQMIPLVMASPVLAAISTVFAFRDSDQRMLELENSTALSWQLLALGRLSVVLAVDCAILMLVSLLAVRFLPGLSIWLLLLSWFTPLLLWASLAFAISLRYGHWTGLLSTCTAWGLQVVLRFAYPQLDLLRIAESRTDVLVRLSAMMLAAVFLAVTMRQAGKSSDWLAARLPR